MKKFILNVIGMLNIILAIIGAILPVMPTVPFLLVAAMCYAKSNIKVYNWLYNNKVFGVILRNFKEKCGLPKWMKIYSIVAMWVGLFVVIIAVPIWWLQIIMGVFGICISIRLVSVKTYDKDLDSRSNVNTQQTEEDSKEEDRNIKEEKTDSETKI